MMPAKHEEGESATQTPAPGHSPAFISQIASVTAHTPSLPHDHS